MPGKAINPNFLLLWLTTAAKYIIFCCCFAAVYQATNPSGVPRSHRHILLLSRLWRKVSHRKLNTLSLKFQSSIATTN